MAIRIERIHLDKEGPLSKDFDLAPGDLSLIYGHNETGKTCLLESLIRILFSTKKGTPFCDMLRPWRGEGNVTVSGLQQEQVTFKPAGSKLDGYVTEQSTLPQDLSRLLVVRAGDTAMSEESDGVGRDVLKSVLSAGGLLDTIASRIKPTVASAKVVDNTIDANRAGLPRRRLETQDDRERIDSLLQEVETAYASGRVADLRAQLESLDEQIAGLVLARRHQAHLLNEQAEAHRSTLSDLPSDDELTTTQTDIAMFERGADELEKARKELETLEQGDEDYRWTSLALEEYDRLSASTGIAGARILFLILSALGLLVTAILAFVNALRGWPLGLSLLLTLAFFIAYAITSQKAHSRAFDRVELRGTQEEFERRFGTPLRTRAMLQSEYDRLHEAHIRADSQRERLDDMESDQRTRHRKIAVALAKVLDQDVPEESWRSVIRDALDQRKAAVESLNRVSLALARLSGPEELPLSEDPGIAWNVALLVELEQERASIAAQREMALSELEGLKDSIKRETGSSDQDWDDLISGLQAKRDETADRYRQFTAEILGKIQVTQVIDEFRQQENERIADGLKRKEITGPLLALTGHYDAVRLGQGDVLHLSAQDGQEYSLSDLSTGAREQVFLALRIGFAAIAMDGQPAFLILDDAFQHSDWERRQNLVNHMVTLIEGGWQIFYFTMDDNIRELFVEAGRQLGERFCEVSL